MTQCVVVDSEFQPRRMSDGSPAQGIDLLQIGAVLLDVGKGGIAVPYMNGRFNLYCRLPLGTFPDTEIFALCGLEYLRGDEVSADEALRQFWAFVGRKTVAAWGDDVAMLVEESKDKNVEVPASLHSIDIRAVSTLARAAIGAKHGGLVNTLEALGLPFVGRQHNALDDAANAATVLGRYLLSIQSVQKLLGDFRAK